jgi:uncharacterized membrane protein YfcA
VRLTEDRDLGRRRLGVLFRAILLVPAVLVAAVWAAVGVVVLPFAWIGALVGGRVPASLHRTLVAALGYVVQVVAWATLVSDRYPLPQRHGRHPVHVQAELERQPRWTVLLRLLLAVPAGVLASVLGIVLVATSVGAWFVSLTLGRTTEGLRELGAFCLRYVAETAAYVVLITPLYPTLAPRVRDEPQAAEAL